MLVKLLAARRRQIGTSKKPWALRAFRQAVLVLRSFCDRSCVHYCLARYGGMSQATGYRWPHEGINILAGRPPPAPGPSSPSAGSGA